MGESVDMLRSRKGDVVQASAPELLPHVVGFFLAFRTVTVLVTVRAFGTEPDLGTAVNVGFDFLLLGIAAFCTQADPRQQHVPILRLSIVRWVLLFLGFSCCSLLWSSAIS